jgi:pimeloyl-ACP methyl ester carboxylesterase
MSGAAVRATAQWVTLEHAGRPQRIECQWHRRERHDRPLLVFLHEGLGSCSMWRDFPQRLCDALDLRGLAYSRPGYGRSSPRQRDEQWGVDFMHRQAHELLPALLKALDVDTAREPPWLLGHSDGASIALLHAARFPLAVAGLVVMAPHLFVEPVAIHSIQQARRRFVEGDLRQRLTAHHDDPDSAFWGWNDIWLHQDFGRWSIEQELSTITCPLLAIQGVDDEYGSLEQLHALARRVPQTRLCILPDCGHSPHRDRPAEVIEAAAAHLARDERPFRQAG